jgi:hypothetical protein
MGVRVDKDVYTASHVLIGSELRFGATLKCSVAIHPADSECSFADGADLAAVRLTPAQFSVLGIRSAKVGTCYVGALASVYGPGTPPLGLRSSGQVGSRLELPLTVGHNITTYPGHSGTPLFVDGKVVAIHIGSVPKDSHNIAVVLKPFVAASSPYLPELSDSASSEGKKGRESWRQRDQREDEDSLQRIRERHEDDFAVSRRDEDPVDAAADAGAMRMLQGAQTVRFRATALATYPDGDYVASFTPTFKGGAWADYDAESRERLRTDHGVEVIGRRDVIRETNPLASETGGDVQPSDFRFGRLGEAPSNKISDEVNSIFRAYLRRNPPSGPGSSLPDDGSSANASESREPRSTSPLLKSDSLASASGPIPLREKPLSKQPSPSSSAKTEGTPPPTKSATARSKKRASKSRGGKPDPVSATPTF